MDEVFFQCAAFAAVGAILGMLLKQYGNPIAITLSISCAGILFLFVLRFLEPVTDFARQLRLRAGLEDDLAKAMLKALGIGLITELSTAICEDAGESALSRMVRFCGSAATIYISLPLFMRLLDLLDELLSKN